MCILLTTKKHPQYPLILLSNRDEYFSRPTQPASFVELCESHPHLSPMDLARQEHGTWIGVNKRGRIAVLVNFKEPLTYANKSVSPVSRGLITSMFLDSDLGVEEWEKDIKLKTEGFKGIGGFSLLCGDLTSDKLMVLSNRSDRTMHVFDPEDEKSESTIGLSNSIFDNPWPKVQRGVKLLEECVDTWSNVESQDEGKFIEDLFQLLSTPTPSSEDWKDATFEAAFNMLPGSIFVPPIKTPQVLYNDPEKPTLNSGLGGYYGTRTQTIILVDNDGNLKYIERNLHSSDDLDEVAEDKAFEFHIEGWMKS